MLGEKLSDPDGVEAGGEIKGMGLLPMETVFQNSKTRTRVSGTFPKVDGALSSLTGVQLEGYEIHMGESVLLEGAHPLTEITDHVQNITKKEMGLIVIMYMVLMCMEFLIKKKLQKM